MIFYGRTDMSGRVRPDARTRTDADASGRKNEILQQNSINLAFQKIMNNEKQLILVPYVKQKEKIKILLVIQMVLHILNID